MLICVKLSNVLGAWAGMIRLGRPTSTDRQEQMGTNLKKIPTSGSDVKFQVHPITPDMMSLKF
jgi:hypothetical protein